MHISVVSPVYLAFNTIDELVRRITESVSKITSDFEIILVDDYSPDGSWQKINQHCQRDKRIKGVRLSRNFGQQLAITAGLSFTRGDYVVVMDCDLQEDPAYIPSLYEQSKKGFDIVYAKRKKRQYGFLKDVTAKFYYKFLSLTGDYDMDPSIGTFSLLSRKVVDSFLRLNDCRRGYLMILKWLGYKSSYISIDHSERYTGRSSYSLKKIFNHALSMTVSYSNKLLLLSVYLGLFFSLASLGGIAYLMYVYFFVGHQEGWTSIMAMISLVGGLIMLLLGIIGLYLNAIFEQVRSRPLFLVDESVNLQADLMRVGR